MITPKLPQLSRALFLLATFCYSSAFGQTISGHLVVCRGASRTTLSISTSGGTWSSGDVTKATIDASTGEVTGIAVGTAEITYTVLPSTYYTAVVTVNSFIMSSIGFSTGSGSMCTGGTHATCAVSPMYGNAWSSSDPSVVTVNTGGLLTSTSTAGTSVITYHHGIGNCNVTKEVTVNPMPTVSVLTPMCNTTTQTVTGTPAGGTWSSSNTGVGTIDATTGELTARAGGSTYIYYTLPSGCRVLTLVSVTNVAAALTGSLVFCAGSSSTLMSSPAGGTWSSSNGGVATIGSSTGLVTGISVGTSTISYTNGAGCSRTAIATVNAALAAIAGPTNVCVGQTITLSNASGGGTWSSSNTSKATVNSSTGVVTGVNTGTTSISYNLGGCTDITTVTISAIPATISGPTSVCVGSDISLSHPIPGGTWSGGSSTVGIIGTTDGVVTGIAPGVFYVTYTLPSGCYKTGYVIVKPSPLPIGGTPAVCVGNYTLMSDPTSGGVWSSSNVSVATVISSMGYVLGVSSGTTIISYTVPSTGCFASRIVTVNTTGGTISGDLGICLGSTSTLSSPGVGTWVSSNTSIATVGSSTGVVTGVGSGTSSITYVNGSGCLGIAVVTIDISADAGTITGSSAVDVGATLVLSNATGGGIWSSSNSSIAVVGSSGIMSGVAPGSVSISYTRTNSCGSAVAVKAVTVSIGGISGTLTTCTGSSTTLASVSAGGSWSSSNTSIATVGSGSGIVNGITAGTAAITYSLGGSDISVILTVSPLPDAGTISGAFATTVDGVASLSSTVTGGIWTSANTSVAVIGSTGIVTGIAPGTANISYSVTNSCGTAVAVTTVTISIAPITGLLSTCTGSTTTLVSSSSGGVWSSSAPSIATIGSVTGILTGIALGTVTISYSLAGSYVTATVTIALTADAGTISGATTLVVGSTTSLSSSGAGGAWSSSNSGVASVGSTGIVTGIGNGTATILYVVAGSCAPDTALQTITVYTVPSGPPVITSLSALSGNPGNSITITGSNFSTVSTFNSVWFGGAKGLVTLASPTSLTVTIPVGALYGQISVTNSSNGMSAFSHNNFTPTFDNSTYLTSVANFDPPVIIPTLGAYAQDMAIADLDGDGKPELITANASTTGLSIFYNVGTPGTLSTSSFSRVDFVFGASGYNLAIHDMDGDGNPDIILYASGGMRIFKNIYTSGVISTSSFAAPVSIGGPVGTPVIDDVDGDGKPDIMAVTGGVLQVSRNVGTPGTITTSSFTFAGSFAVNGSAVQLSIGDIDGDGRNDAVVASFPSNDIAILRNTSSPGTVSFATKYDLAASGDPYGVVVGDLNADGKPDIAINNIHGIEVTAYRNTASPGSISSSSFGTGTNVSIPYCYPLSIAIGDLNGDSKPDLVMGDDWMSRAVVSLNSSSASSYINFPGNAAFSLESGSSGYPRYIKVADLDGDGIQDMITSNMFGLNYSLFRNSPIPAIFGASSVCTAATSTYSIAATGGVWTSLTPATASIGSSSGIVTGLVPGEARIRYTLSGEFVTEKNFIINPFAGYISSANTVTVGATISAYIYLYAGGAITGGTWSSSDPGIASVGSTGVITGVSVGTTTISYSVDAPCGTAVARRTITVNPLVSPKPGMPDIDSNGEAAIAVYPNPTSGMFNVEAGVNGSVAIYTIDGRELKEYTVNAGVSVLALPDKLVSGVYMLRFKGDDGSTKMVRLVYER